MDEIEDVENLDKNIITESIEIKEIKVLDLSGECIVSNIEKDKIKHIVISGGSIWGFYAYGSIKEACRQGFIDMNSIESIYGTSVGALIAVILSLKIDFEWIDDYLIRRPWQKILNMNIINIYQNKGMFSHDFFEDLFSSLLKAKDISMTVTMLELYNITGIEIHMYSTELNEYKLHDFSYKTHPDLQVLDAVHASCALPILISPVIQNNNCWMDGGFFLNYPITKCLETVSNKHEIFGINLGNRRSKPDTSEKEVLNKDSEFTDILMTAFTKIIQNSFFMNKDKGIIPYEINMYADEITMTYFTAIVKDPNERSRLIQRGVDETREHLEKWFS